MPPNNYKTITVPDWAYNAALQARTDLLHHGLASVPSDVLQPPVCPHCGGPVEHVTVGVQHVKCGGCGYSQQTVSVNGNALAQVGLGVVIGLGLAALYKVISDANAQPPQLRAARSARRAPARRVKKRSPKKLKRR